MRKFVVFSICLVSLAGMYLGAQQRQHVAVLVNEVGKGESVLIVEWVSQGSVGATTMVEDRDRGATATGVVKHVHDNHIILKEKLGKGFPAGSRVYQ